MTDSQTLHMYSGHPMGLFPSSPSAPRVVVTNGMIYFNSSNNTSVNQLQIPVLAGNGVKTQRVEKLVADAVELRVIPFDVAKIAGALDYVAPIGPLGRNGFIALWAVGRPEDRREEPSYR